MDFYFIWPSVIKEHSIKVATVLNDPLFLEYEVSSKRLRYLRNRHEAGMVGIRGLSLLQAYFAYLSHYKYTSGISPTLPSQLYFVALRIATFLVVSDTINFNVFYN